MAVSDPPLPLSPLLRPGSGLVGLGRGRAAGDIVSTVQGDGVTSTNANDKGYNRLWATGPKSPSTFLTPTIYGQAAQSYAVAVSNGAAAKSPAAKSPTHAQLWTWSHDMEGVSLERGVQRTQLPPGAVHSLHALGGSLAHSGTAAGAAQPPAAQQHSSVTIEEVTASAAPPAGFAVVFSDGAACIVSPPAADAQPAKDGLSENVTRVPKPKLTAGQRVAAAAAEEEGSGLAVVCSSPTETTVLLYDLQDPTAAASSFRLPAPSDGATVCRASLDSRRLVLLWSDGTLQSYGLEAGPRKQGKQLQRHRARPHLPPGCQASLRLAGFAMSDTCQVSAGAAAAAATAKSQPQPQPDTPLPKKKRKTPLVNGVASATPVANGTAGKPAEAQQQQQQQQQPAAVTPAIALLGHDTAVVAGWSAAGADSGASPTGRRLRLAVVELKYGSVRSVSSASVPGASGLTTIQMLLLGSEGQLAFAVAGRIHTCSIQAAPVSLASVVGALAVGPLWRDATAAARAAKAVLASSPVGPAVVPPDWRAALEDAAKEALAPMPAGHLARPVQLRDSNEVQRPPLPDPTAELLARLAVQGGEAPTAAAAEAAVAAAAASPAAIRPDATGAAAAACCERQHWSALSIMAQTGLLGSLRVAPALASQVLEAGKLRLFGQLLHRASDVGTLELRRLLLRLLPRPQSDTGSVTAEPDSLAAQQQQIHGELRSAAEAAVAAAEAADGADSRQLHAAACLAAAVESFSPEEVSLHPLVSGDMGATVISEAAASLNSRQALALLRYLATWLRLHAQLLGGWQHAPGRRRRRGGAGSRPGATATSSAAGATTSSAATASAAEASGAQTVDAAEAVEVQEAAWAADPSEAAAEADEEALVVTLAKGNKRKGKQKQKQEAAEAAANGPIDMQVDSNGGGSSRATRSKGGKEEAAPGKQEAEARREASPPGGALAAADPAAAAAVEGDVTAVWAVPPLQKVVEWAAAVLDGQLAALAPSAACREVLQAMQEAVEAQLAETQRMQRLRGAVDHLRSGAPLPAPRDAAALYAVEQLDLRTL